MLVGYVEKMKNAANRPPLVVFGITGDLARKKIFSALYELAQTGRPFRRVVGVGRSDWATSNLRRAAVEAVSASNDTEDEALDAFVESLAYVKGDYDNAETFEAIAALLGDAELVKCHGVSGRCEHRIRLFSVSAHFA